MSYLPILSNSSLKEMHRCPRCFWVAKKLKVEKPKGIIPTLQRGMDTVIKEYWDNLRKSKKEVRIDIIKEPKIYLYQNQQNLDEWRNWKTGLPRYSNKYVTLMGAIDEIGYEKSGNKKYLLPMDYKTRESGVRDGYGEKWHKLQLSIYSFLLNKAKILCTNYGIPLYYFPEKVIDKNKFSFNRMHEVVLVDYILVEESLDKAIKILEMSKPPESNPNCEYCNWLNQIIYIKNNNWKTI